MFKRFGEFLAKTDRNIALHLPDDPYTDEEVWVYSIHTDDGENGLIFSVHTNKGKVTNLHGRGHDWLFERINEGDFIDTPQYVRDEINERVNIKEDPRDLAILDDTCTKCQIKYQENVVPRVDLQIDGLLAQRIVVEYCPKCGGQLVNRRTIDPPQLYTMEWHDEYFGPEVQFDPKEVDLSDHTWEHGRI